MSRLSLCCIAVLAAAPAAALEAPVPAFDALLAPEAFSALPAPTGVMRTLVATRDGSAPTAAEPAPPAENLPLFDCADDPGICRKMQSLETLALQDCQGSGCYSLFSQHRVALNDFARRYDNTMPWRYRATREAGNVAYNAARAICGMRISNVDTGYLTSYITSMNEALRRLRSIQRGARRENIAYCTMGIE